MISQTDMKKNQLEITVGLFLAAVVGIIFAPILICSGFFAYMGWASYHSQEERKRIRSAIVLVTGFMFTAALWRFLSIHADILGFGLVGSEKMMKLFDKPILKDAHFGYLVLVPLGLWYFEKKSNSSLVPFEKIRSLAILSFAPFKILQIPVAAGVGLLLSFADEKSDRKKPTMVFHIGVSLLAFFIIGWQVEGIKEPRGLGNFLGGILGFYLVCYWYHLVAHCQQKPAADLNFIEQMSQDGLLIGTMIKPNRRDLKLSWNDLNHHIHILGQPGAGKSVLLKNIYAHQIASGEGLLMLDLKADIDVKEDFVSLCNETGRSNDLILIDLSNPKESFGYNPLLMGNATELKDKIIGSIEWSEVYYKKVSERVLLTVLRGFVNLRDQQGIVPTLEDLCFALSGVQGLSLLAEKAQEIAIKNDLNSLIAGFSKESSKDLEGLRSDLTLLVQSEFGAIFSKPNSLNVLQAIQEKKVVLVNLDGQTYNESAKRFGRLLLADLRSASGAIVTKLSKEDRPQFTVIVDEFSDIVSTDDMAKTFVGFLNRCRGSGIGVVIAHQSLGDFKDPTVKSQIMDSTETLFSFVQKDPDTADTLASIVGTKEAWVVTEQTQQSFVFDEATGMGTRKLVQEYIYHPNEFKNLPTGVAIYAAKKPTRHGVVQVRMLDIPRIVIPAAAAKPDLRDGLEGSLGFSADFQRQRAGYADSFRRLDPGGKSVKPDGRLEI